MRTIANANANAIDIVVKLPDLEHKLLLKIFFFGTFSLSDVTSRFRHVVFTNVDIRSLFYLTTVGCHLAYLTQPNVPHS